MLHDLAQLLKAIAWPGVLLTALILLLPQLRKMAEALAEKIREANRVKIGGKSGIELATEVVRVRMRSLDSEKKESEADLAAEFERLCIEYDNTDSKGLVEYEEHVSNRMRLANRLGDIACKLRLDRSGLADSASEAKLVALATAIVNAPLATDLKNLCAASATAKFRFTRYRIVLALLPTLSRPDLSARVLASCNTVLDNTDRLGTPPADDALKKIIDKTRHVVEEAQATLARR